MLALRIFAGLQCKTCGLMMDSKVLASRISLVMLGKKYEYCPTCGAETDEETRQSALFQRKWEKTYKKISEKGFIKA